MAATDGAVAFDAVFAAVERGIDIAVANKELIVAAGELLVDAANRSGAQLLPVDCEHSAIFQCLVGEEPESVAGIVLTASGGPFWRTSREEMERADLAAALAHPTWRMGTKNTIDSATMMNKGLEVIEASRLFGFAGRAGAHRRASAIDRPRIRALYRRQREGAARLSGHALADRVRPGISRPAAATTGRGADADGGSSGANPGAVAAL